MFLAKSSHLSGEEVLLPTTAAVNIKIGALSSKPNTFIQQIANTKQLFGLRPILK